MTVPNIFHIATRGRETVDFIAYEESTPNGETREVVPMPDDLSKVKDLFIGCLVDDKCLPVKFKTVADVKADAVAGISLQAVDVNTGLTKQYKDTELCYLTKPHAMYPIEIKDTILEDAVSAAVDGSVTTPATVKAIQDAVRALIVSTWSVVVCGA
ncbi:hypothetical protein [Lelliottia wanjuensis]|uniref:hypothetical protein n=1 Tax=Lelliottia wanjuensis TaxID=3050585 RepID=UPI00254C5786|nr:hypothetical protein [Lelliottia sp. V86_10]MDK9585876.1 hypothetical protein [Lelliottia sp. V86_10]